MILSDRDIEDLSAILIAVFIGLIILVGAYYLGSKVKEVGGARQVIVFAGKEVKDIIEEIMEE